MVEHIVTILQNEYKQRGFTFKTWILDTDGARGHFKSRYAIFSMLNVRQFDNGCRVLWHFCAPGHGKGPCDGLDVFALGDANEGISYMCPRRLQQFN